MDRTSLESALPAALVTSLTLLTDAAQVTVGLLPPSAPTDPACYLRPLAAEDEGAGIGSHMESSAYAMEIVSQAATLATLRAAAHELRAAFHGRRLPASIDGMHWCEVAELELDVGHGPDLALRGLLRFHGTREPYD